MNSKYAWGKLVIRERRKNQPQKENKSLKSVLETTEVDSLIEAAEIVEYDFQQHGSIKAHVRNEIDSDRAGDGTLETGSRGSEGCRGGEAGEDLAIPQKPSSSLGREEYKNEERKLFNKWKLQMNNALGGSGAITPYERNINVWRQFWFAVEKSDLIVQIVDARNPLLFYNGNIQKMNKEKRHLLLLNKSDLLSEIQKSEWSKYFSDNGIDHLFFSAHRAEDAEKLLNAIESAGGVKMVGMVGYPNVGKSSTINSLFRRKVVKTSIVPGKTKSIQTLEIKEGLSLCDCPGLVFPAFAAVKQDLILNGILSLDHTREVKGCLSLIIERVGVRELCYILGVKEFVNDSRRTVEDNFMKAVVETGGCVEEGKVVKNIVKNYIEGVIKYVHAPPKRESAEEKTIREKEFNKHNYNIPDTFLVNLEKSYAWRTQEKKRVEVAEKDLEFSKKHYLKKGLQRVFKN